MHILKSSLAIAAFAAIVLPASAFAQSFGIGPHLSFIREHSASNTPASRMWGGTIRLTNSRSLGLELAMDYKATRNELETERVRERLKEIGAPVRGIEGGRNAEWVLVDAGDIVVHVMHPTVRDYYNLEEIWGGKQVRLKASGKAPRRRVRS